MRIRRMLVACLLATAAATTVWAAPAMAASDPPDTGPAASANVWIRNQYSGACMDDPGWSRSPVRIDQWGCVRQANEYWEFVWVGDFGGVGRYQIVNKHSHLCLNVQGNSHLQNAPVIQWYCGEFSNAEFLLFNNNGKYQMVPLASINFGSPMCVDLASRSRSWGEKLVQKPCSSSPTQRWTLWSV